MQRTLAGEKPRRRQSQRPEQAGEMMGTALTTPPQLSLQKEGAEPQAEAVGADDDASVSSRARERTDAILRSLTTRFAVPL